MKKRTWKYHSCSPKFPVGTLVDLRPGRALYNTIILEDCVKEGPNMIFTVKSGMIGMVINYIDDSLSAEVLMEGRVVLVGPNVVQDINHDET